jgi:hypothetical protein
MRLRLHAVSAIAFAIAGLAASGAQAGGDACFRLWNERNAIYKAHGYCFHTGQARAYFGNFGCAFWDDDAVPLPPGASARIADLVEREYAYGCRAPYGYGYGYRADDGDWD